MSTSFDQPSLSAADGLSGGRQPEPLSRQVMEGALPKLRILVVDDHHDSANSLTLMLRIQGYEVQAAHTGVGALEAATAFQPDAVLLDLAIPNLNGFDIAQRLREQPQGAPMTLIALTGLTRAEDRQRAQACGFDHFLVKPADLIELRKLLDGIPRRNGVLPG